MPKSPKSDDILAAFGQCTRILDRVFHENPRLELVEQMFLESHLSLIRSAYEGWKRRTGYSAKIGVHWFLPELHPLRIHPSPAGPPLGPCFDIVGQLCSGQGGRTRREMLDWDFVRFWEVYS